MVLQQRMCTMLRCMWYAGMVYAGTLYARLPPDIPGEEISDRDYLHSIVPSDSISAKVPSSSSFSPTWLDAAMESWDAPALAKQISLDNTPIPMGKGAIFIPSLTKALLEPEIEILNTQGDLVEAGRSGKRIPVVPGIYYVLYGSGAHQQRLVKTVTVSEQKIEPVLPDWAGLTLDVIDENAVSFAGDYEIARMGNAGFEPFGRGIGKDPNLGEDTKTWILKPGTYKIFGVGQSYTTLKNYITVRLLPGELVRCAVIENRNDLTILGGGSISGSADRNRVLHWLNAVDLGGNILFGSTNDRQKDTVTNTTDFSLLLNYRLNYRNDPVEWDTRLRWDETFNFSGLNFLKLSPSVNELRLTTLFVWRFFPLFGPYGRTDILTYPFPVNAYFNDAGLRHTFIRLSEDSLITSFDTVKTSTPLQPIFSSFTIESGIGANLDVLNFHFIEAKLRAGIGLTYQTTFNQHNIVDATYPRGISHSDSQSIDSANRGAVMYIQRNKDISIISYGPEAALTLSLRLGRYATIATEGKILAPLSRAADINWGALVTWHISRVVNMDYQYQYTLLRPKEELGRKDLSQHMVRLRFSLSSRR